MKIWIDGKEEDALLLHIKSKWFQMILTGEKTEEYRSFTQYYRSRFRNIGMLSYDGASITGVERYVLFQNGYAKKDPHFVAKCVLDVGEGIPDWGAEKNTVYYILKIREIIPDERVVIL